MKKILLLSFFVFQSLVGFSQIFITELADPNDNATCRFVELYNAGSSAVDLSAGEYKLGRYTNANTSFTTLNLTGTIPANGFYIVGKSTFMGCYGFAADQTSSSIVVDSNGDDQIVLVQGGGNTQIDIFGVIGEDGTETCHEFEDGRAERAASVTGPNATWDAAEWNVWADNERTDGNGNVCVINDPQNVSDMDPGSWIGATPISTTIQFNGISAAVGEDAGTVSMTVCVSITGEDAINPTMGTVTLTGGTATNGTDITTFNPTMITFPAGDNTNQCISFTVTDDGDDEGAETLEFTLSNPTGGNSAALGGNILFTVTINDNDFVAPDVRINEFDTDQTGADTEEFVELFSTAGANLDGTMLVLFNGNGDTEYESHDLDGITIAAGGYYVICFGSNTQSYCDVTVGGSSPQNGADAIALYVGNPGDVSGVTTANLIDALVYDTNDGDDSGLLGGLGQIDQINEDENNDSENQSIQRGSWFVADPTPGAPNMALPVEMTHFRAQKEAETVVLYWQTASETHNDRFEVEHSTTGINFRQIGEIKGAHNSHTILNYEFNHQTPENGVNYYRLRQVDEDGAFEYSNVISVLIGKNETILVRPNIVENNMFIELDSPVDDDILLEVFDLQGRLVKSYTLQNGNAQLELDLSSLNSGKYFIKAIDNGQLNVIRFVKL